MIFLKIIFSHTVRENVFPILFSQIFHMPFYFHFIYLFYFFAYFSCKHFFPEPRTYYQLSINSISYLHFSSSCSTTTSRVGWYQLASHLFIFFNSLDIFHSLTFSLFPTPFVLYISGSTQ